jgi:hypothetical protein
MDRWRSLRRTILELSLISIRGSINRSRISSQWLRRIHQAFASLSKMSGHFAGMPNR